PEQPHISLGELFAWGAGLAAGVLGFFAALVLVTRVDLPYIFRYNLDNAALAEAGRPYAVWLLFGPLDFVQFLGLPLALAVVLSLVVKPWQIQGSGVRGRGSGTVVRMQTLTPDPRPLIPLPWYSRVNMYALALVLVV